MEMEIAAFTFIWGFFQLHDSAHPSSSTTFAPRNSNFGDN